MSAGNIFTLQINDGKQDRLLNATDRLINRLKAIQTARIADAIGRASAHLTTLLDKDPGNLKVEAELQKFKNDPFTYCSHVPQPIYPVFRELDNSHTCYINSQWKPSVPMSYMYLRSTEKEGNAMFDSTVSFKINQESTWIGDQVLHIKLTGFKALVQPDKVKYCEFVGHRLLESVQFRVGETVISEYGTEDINKYFQFDIPTNKMVGWCRNVGQEIPHVGYMTTDPRNVNFREYRLIGDGPQTHKSSQEDLDLWIPLLFWYNTNLAQAFPAIKIPYGNIKVTVKLRRLSDIVSVADYGGGGGFQPPAITTMELYTNHIETIPEVANVVLRGYEFTMVRVNKRFETVVNQPTGEILLKDLKYPVEAIFATFRPLANLTDPDNWHRGNFLTPVQIKEAVVVDSPNPNTISINVAIYNRESPAVDDLSLKINDIEIYQQNPSRLYSSYLPFTANGMNTPRDSGWVLFNLCLQYGNWNPSGHINISKNRELYIKYTSSQITDQARAKLYVIARTINFISIRPNTAYLRFV